MLKITSYHQAQDFIFPYGLSDEDGEEEFYLPLNSKYVSGSVVHNKSLDGMHPIKVKMRRLRTLLEELNHKEIDIIKMDIEGAEFKVIQDIVNSEDGKVRFGLLCMETHKCFFKNSQIEKELYEIMNLNEFYDL